MAWQGCTTRTIDRADPEPDTQAGGLPPNRAALVTYSLAGERPVIYWDVFTMHGANSVGMVYAKTEAEALEKARRQWVAVVYVKPYKS